MTQREKDLFYEVLELLRKEVRTSSDFRNRDWKDADDYIFSAEVIPSCKTVLSDS